MELQELYPAPNLSMAACRCGHVFAFDARKITGGPIESLKVCCPACWAAVQLQPLANGQWISGPVLPTTK